MTFKDVMEGYQKTVEAYLQTLFAEDAPQKQLFDAMRYSLLAGRQAHPPDSGAGILPDLRRRDRKGTAVCGGNRDGSYVQSDS